MIQLRLFSVDYEKSEVQCLIKRNNVFIYIFSIFLFFCAKGILYIIVIMFDNVY